MDACTVLFDEDSLRQNSGDEQAQLDCGVSINPKLLQNLSLDNGATCCASEKCNKSLIGKRSLPSPAKSPLCRACGGRYYSASKDEPIGLPKDDDWTRIRNGNRGKQPWERCGNENCNKSLITKSSFPGPSNSRIYRDGADKTPGSRRI